MDEKTDMQDYASTEFDEGYNAWCDMKSTGANPYEKYSIAWVVWHQGWKEAQCFKND